MHKATFPLISLFLFVFLSVPAIALYDFDIEKTTTYGASIYLKALDCINATDDTTIYCYVFTSDRIYRYDENWENVESCAFTSADCGSVNFRVAVINETTAIYGNTTTAMILNLTGMDQCNIIYMNSTTGDALKDAFVGVGNANAFRGSVSEGQIYTRNHTVSVNDWSIVSNPFWEYYRVIFSAPDKEDNTTLYIGQEYPNICGCIRGGSIEKYVDGVLNRDFGELIEYYSIGASYKSVQWDIIEINGTEYIYIVDDVNQPCDYTDNLDYLYRADWSLVEGATCNPVNISEGAWCDDYDTRKPCCWSETENDWTTLSPPQCTFDLTNCYDLYGVLPNYFENLTRTFTVYNFSAPYCVDEYGACPVDYVCRQFYNSATDEFEGKVSCYNGNNGTWVFYNETGDLFNGTAYIESYTVDSCSYPSQYNNAWSCEINYCQWCPLAQTCTYNTVNCADLTTSDYCINSTTICYDQNCNIVNCAGGISDLRDWLNQSMRSEFGSDIIALITSTVIAIMVFINIDKDNKNPAILFGTFLLCGSVFSFVGLLTAWFLVLEATLVGVLIFWKVKGG